MAETIEVGSTLEIYVKDCTNVRGGMPLTSFTVLSETWEGESLRLPFGGEGGSDIQIRTIVGWCDLLFDNPYPDVVRGCPTTVSVTKVQWGTLIGYLVHGGNYGLRIGGRNGWGYPIIWVAQEDMTDLPAKVRRIVEPK